MEKYFLFFRAFGANSPARRDLFSLAGVPHARGMPRAQDDGKNGSCALEFTRLPSPYLRLSRGTLAREKRKLRVRIYTFTPMLTVVTRCTFYTYSRL